MSKQFSPSDRLVFSDEETRTALGVAIEILQLWGGARTRKLRYSRI